ncbi:MAG: class I SAM-dependent methyltransferase [Chloroflexi bacterium]|nr:class I SAM-dependent methyltransferase [Chloroflexota bacterium]
MSLLSGARGAYFDRVYLPVYDWTVGRLAPYQRLLERCQDLLAAGVGHRVLSIGVGTGNEVVHLLGGNGSGGKAVMAVDLSRAGLMRSYQKARSCSAWLGVCQMDAHRLALADGSFDRVLCVHTLDFVADPGLASKEIVRVLRKGGQFVATYPMGRGGAGLAAEVGGSILAKVRRLQLGDAALEFLAGVGAVGAYLPLALSLGPQRTFPSQEGLERMLAELALSEYTVEQERAYQDFIVWGRK